MADGFDLFGGQVVAEGQGDGALGDNTGADGLIVDPGGPAAIAVPTLPWWATITLAALLLASAIWVRRRSRPVGV